MKDTGVSHHLVAIVLAAIIRIMINSFDDLGISCFASDKEKSIQVSIEYCYLSLDECIHVSVANI